MLPERCCANRKSDFHKALYDARVYTIMGLTPGYTPVIATKGARWPPRQGTLLVSAPQASIKTVGSYVAFPSPRMI